MKKKFEIGKIYLRPGLFIPSFHVRIVDRTNETITYEEVDFPGQYTTHLIDHDREGNEVIEVWSYYDMVGYMEA